MSVYAFAHVQEGSVDAVEAALSRALTTLGAQTVSAQTGPYRSGLLRPLGSSGLPEYVALASDGSGWTRIALSTFHPLDELMRELSRELYDAHVLILTAESVSDSYLLGISRRGETLFRAEAIGGEDGAKTIASERFSEFVPDEEEGLSFELMQRCARSLGVEPEFNVDSCVWRTLQLSWPKVAKEPRKPKKRRFFGLF
jgi:hypothetical protein